MIILAISLAFGFLFDFVCEKIEFAIYKKPEQIKEYVDKYSYEFGVPENLVYSVIKTESGFDSSAVSPKGAIGLMQMTKSTFIWLTNDKLSENLDDGMLYDPETNIKYGVYYLSVLYRQYKNWNTALAAYNAGPGNVDEWLENKEYSSNGITLTKIPYKETRNYLKKVNSSLEKYNSLYNTD